MSKPKSIFTKPETVFCQTVDDDLVLLDVTSEVYYCLDEAGHAFWESAIDATDFNAAIDKLAAMYDAPREQIEQDFHAFMKELEQLGLILRTES